MPNGVIQIVNITEVLVFYSNCLFLAGNVLKCEFYSGRKVIFFFLSDEFLSDSLLLVKFNRADRRDPGEHQGAACFPLNLQGI